MKENILSHILGSTYDKIKILGRTKVKDDTLYFNYTCSGLEFKFTGKKVSAILCSSNYFKEKQFKAYIGVFINDEERPSKYIQLSYETKEYVLYESDAVNTVNIKIIKLSEAAFEKCGIKMLKVDDGIIEAPENKKHKIEFIGDSITCGYGNEGILDKDIFDTAQENGWQTFAAKTARYFDADFNCVSWSGIGIITAYTDDGEINTREWLMPILYKYTDGELDKREGLSENEFEVWNNNKFKPDLIVINLGTNDFSYTKDIEERRNHFKREYYNFIIQVKESNPDSVILCTLGVMGDELYECVEEAVTKAREEDINRKVYSMRFDLQKESNGIGTDSHPSIKTHEEMSKKLINKIQEIMGW